MNILFLSAPISDEFVVALMKIFAENNCNPIVIVAPSAADVGMPLIEMSMSGMPLFKITSLEGLSSPGDEAFLTEIASLFEGELFPEELSSFEDRFFPGELASLFEEGTSLEELLSPEDDFLPADLASLFEEGPSLANLFSPERIVFLPAGDFPPKSWEDMDQLFMNPVGRVLFTRCRSCFYWHLEACLGEWSLVGASKFPRNEKLGE